MAGQAREARAHTHLAQSAAGRLWVWR
jgi:hypothetical protein